MTRLKDFLRIVVGFVARRENRGLNPIAFPSDKSCLTRFSGVGNCALRGALASVFLLLAAMWAPISSAGLVSTVHVDTLTDLSVSWTWNPEGTGNNMNSPALVNWDVSLGISIVLLGDRFVVLNARHRTDPHPELGEAGGGDLAGFSFDFNDAASFGLLYDKTALVAHSPSHSDSYHFTFDRSALPENTAIRLTGHHVPEPSTIFLLCAGAVGVLGLGRRRPRWTAV